MNNLPPNAAFTGAGSFLRPNQAGVNVRKEKDVHKLMVSEFNVTIPNEDDTNELKVEFSGPKDSPYDGVSPACFADY